jgi:phenylpropionate dioxygenase-like ring-hydroxylating dioxygenase large terminal subunit
MLTRDENERLTRVGPGTAMGTLFRRYWIPALLSSEVPENDGKPVRVRLLGEDLVAFRDSLGRVGLLEEACPHRRTSLAIALNDACGLRCLYHGYKFDVTGACVDTPTEPEASRFSSKIRATAYPVREAAGMVWAYLGPVDLQPPFPAFEWFDLPAENIGAFKVYGECNYAQMMEGAIDSAHAGVLHRRSAWDGPAALAFEADLRPRLEVEYTKYGMRYGALRVPQDDGMTHVRITAVALPCWTFIPPFPGGPKAERRLVNAFVPRDDESTWHFQYWFNREAPFDVEHRKREGGLELDAAFKKASNRANDYRQDRARMKRDQFSGIDGILVQDHAVSETQGAIVDRTREHLGTSDIALIAWRRMMLRAAKELAEGVPPPGVEALPFAQIHAATVDVAGDTSWQSSDPLVPALAR